MVIYSFRILLYTDKEKKYSQNFAGDVKMNYFMAVFKAVYRFLWGDIITIPLPGGSSLGLSLLVLILIPSGVYFTIRTKFLPFRLFPEMLRVVMEKKNVSEKNSISGVQALIISTATRVGMGNLVGVVAAISAGGAGADRLIIFIIFL